MNQVSEVTTIIKNHIKWLPIGPKDSLVNTPNVFFISLSFPGIDSHTLRSYGSSSMILGGKYITRAPLNLKFEEALFKSTVPQQLMRKPCIRIQTTSNYAHSTLVCNMQVCSKRWQYAAAVYADEVSRNMSTSVST